MFVQLESQTPLLLLWQHDAPPLFTRDTRETNATYAFRSAHKQLQIMLVLFIIAERSVGLVRLAGHQLFSPQNTSVAFCSLKWSVKQTQV